MLTTSAGIALVAMLVTAGATPLAGAMARRLGWMDHPDERLKRHVRPTPYLGGAAVYLGFLLSLTIFKFWESSTLIGVVGVVSGTSTVVLLGLVDDRHRLSPWIKFAGQTVAALILIACNMRLQFIHQPVLSVILTVLWVVGVTNAMNLIDIMDGLSTGIAVIAAALFFWVAWLNGRYNDMYIMAALGGAALGFLPFNFPRATIYLGDTGALMLGFVLSSVAMGERYSEINPLGILAPLLILAVPIFDTLFIMFIRHRRGVSMFLGSPDHVALRLVRLGLSKTRTVLLLWGVNLVLGLAAIATIRLPLHWALLIDLAAMLGALFAAERISGFSMEPEP